MIQKNVQGRRGQIDREQHHVPTGQVMRNGQEGMWPKIESTRQIDGCVQYLQVAVQMMFVCPCC